jgi:hypothetical protein
VQVRVQRIDIRTEFAALEKGRVQVRRLGTELYAGRARRFLFSARFDWPGPTAALREKSFRDIYARESRRT